MWLWWAGQVREKIKKCNRSLKHWRTATRLQPITVRHWTKFLENQGRSCCWNNETPPASVMLGMAHCSGHQLPQLLSGLSPRVLEPGSPAGLDPGFSRIAVWFQSGCLTSLVSAFICNAGIMILYIGPHNSVQLKEVTHTQPGTEQGLCMSTMGVDGMRAALGALSRICSMEMFLAWR